jgi:hypothetical protein
MDWLSVQKLGAFAWVPHVMWTRYGPEPRCRALFGATRAANRIVSGHQCQLTHRHRLTQKSSSLQILLLHNIQLQKPLFSALRRIPPFEMNRNPLRVIIRVCVTDIPAKLAERVYRLGCDFCQQNLNRPFNKNL